MHLNTSKPPIYGILSHEILTTVCFTAELEKIRELIREINMRIVLLGAPGSGKGTQAKFIMDTFGIPQISTGDLLRGAVAAGTELGKKAKAVMEAGELVSDDLVLGIIRDRLSEKDTDKGFILDGFPRNTSQAEALDLLLEQEGKPLQAAIHFDVDFDLIIKRITGRRSCDNCGAIFNVHFSAPKQDDKCDSCGHEGLTHRADDNEETVRNRLNVYQEQTAPLIDLYDNKGILKTLSGEGEISEITERVTNLVEAI